MYVNIEPQTAHYLKREPWKTNTVIMEQQIAHSVKRKQQTAHSELGELQMAHSAPVCPKICSDTVTYSHVKVLSKP